MSNAFRAIEHIISEEFVNVAMEAVRPGLDDGVENRAVPAAEFGAVGVGLNFEFLDGIDGRLNHVSLAGENVAEIRIVVHAIEQIIILQRSRAIRAESITGFHARARLARNDSRAQQRELRIIAAVEWQRDRSISTDYLPEIRSLGFEQRARAVTVTVSSTRPNLQRHVDRRMLLDFHHHWARQSAF